MPNPDQADTDGDGVGDACSGVRFIRGDGNQDGLVNVGDAVFLLHEQPEDARRKTIEQALRVTRPGGRVVFVDYHGPKKTNPMRYVMKPILTWLEPFAMDLWREELPAFMPAAVDAGQIASDFYFGGLYQKIVLQL